MEERYCFNIGPIKTKRAKNQENIVKLIGLEFKLSRHQQFDTFFDHDTPPLTTNQNVLNPRKKLVKSHRVNSNFGGI